MEKKKFIIDNKLVFYTGLIYFIIMALFVVLKILAYFNLFNFSGASYVYKIIVQIGLMLVLPLVLFSVLCKKSAKQTFDTFSFRKISGKAIFISFALGICLFILIGYVSSLWSGILSLFGYKFSSASGDYSVLSFVMSVLFVGILPGFCEEVAHRGLIVGGIKKDGHIRAIVLCGLLFGLMHFNPVQFGYAFVAGMFFSFVTMISKSIFPAMIMHFTNNTLSTIVLFANNSDWFPSNMVDWFNNLFTSGNTFLIILLNLLILLITTSILCYLCMKLFVEGKKSQFKRFQKNLEKELKSTELEAEINTKDKSQVLQIYEQVNLLNLEKKLKNGTFSLQDLAGEMSTKKTFELFLSDNLSLPEKKRASNYIFYYLAIFLGALGTILTFILNIL